MDSINAFIGGLGILADVQLWLFVAFGIVMGLIFGVVPGISGMTALSILLPFVFRMPPEYALSLFIATAAVSMTGGSITSVLLGIPGDGVNAATIIDGYPMTQKGQGGRALGAALTSSAVGGFVSVLFALIMIPVILPFIFAVNSGDMVFLILMGFSCIAALTTGSVIKGLIACFIGTIFSIIGLHSVTGVVRFTLGTVYLIGGIPTVPVILGLFALPEMIELAAGGGTITKAGKLSLAWRNVAEGCKDVFRHWGLALRSSIIGYIVGVIPGVGGNAAIWITYGQAKQTSKHPDQFGEGSVEGVIAPETSNKAEYGGAVLTTLAIGLPGNAPMVLVLGAIMILGIRPGPEMMTEHLALSMSLLQVLFIANAAGSGICLLLAQQMARIATVPVRFLVPLLIVVVYIGAFANDDRFFDMVTMLVFTVIGLAMKEFGFMRPALVIGFILGDLLEKYLSVAYSLNGPLFFMRPISLVIILITLLLLLYKPLSGVFARKTSKGAAKA